MSKDQYLWPFFYRDRASCCGYLYLPCSCPCPSMLCLDLFPVLGPFLRALDLGLQSYLESADQIEWADCLKTRVSEGSSLCWAVKRITKPSINQDRKHTSFSSMILQPSICSSIISEWEIKRISKKSRDMVLVWFLNSARSLLRLVFASRSKSFGLRMYASSSRVSLEGGCSSSPLSSPSPATFTPESNSVSSRTEGKFSWSSSSSEMASALRRMSAFICSMKARSWIVVASSSL